MYMIIVIVIGQLTAYNKLLLIPRYYSLFANRSSLEELRFARVTCAQSPTQSASASRLDTTKCL